MARASSMSESAWGVFIMRISTSVSIGPILHHRTNSVRVPMQKKTIPAGAVACLIAVPTLAQAQTARAPAEDPLTEVVVTATRAGDGARADLLGASFSILDADALEVRQTRIVS